MNWTEEMETYFISLLMEQLHIGNHENIYNGATWTTMALLLNQRFGLNADSNELESRYALLMKQHNEITQILNHGGFAWDETQNVIIGENSAWDDYIKVIFFNTKRCVLKLKILCQSLDEMFTLSLYGKICWSA